eukprot:6204157-Pleurochrysis_carterae.AAC.4
MTSLAKRRYFSSITVLALAKKGVSARQVSVLKCRHLRCGPSSFIVRALCTSALRAPQAKGRITSLPCVLRM